MIRHLIKIVWNRKRTNALITIEIMVSFLIVFVLICSSVYFAYNYTQPLGFEYKDVWNVTMEIPTINFQAEEQDFSNELETVRVLISELKSMPEVEQVTASMGAPFDHGSMTSGFDYKNVRVEAGCIAVDDNFASVFKVDLIEGRWFDQTDKGQNYRPVVLNQRMARLMFPGVSAVGQTYQPHKKDSVYKVVGIVSDFREHGDFSAPSSFFFSRVDLTNSKTFPPLFLQIRLRPGTTAAFEEKLVKQMTGVAKGWGFNVKPFTEMRETVLREVTAPMIAVGLVAGFLLLMVALGLTGVLWQNVTQRTKEIGLRRAKGATAAKIYQQILGEMAVVASFGMIAGSLIVVQLPLFDLLSFISGHVYGYSFTISVLIIYVITLVCSVYPSRLATKVKPAEALHYE